MAEVAYELRNTGQFLAGPEQGIPSVGYPYAAILSELVAHPTQTGKELGITFGTKLLQSPAPGTSTVSLVDLSRIAPLAPALDQLGSALIIVQTTQSSAIVAARNSAESSGNHNLESRDLGDFLQLLNIQDSSVTAAITQVQSVIGTAVVWNGSTEPGSRAQGLAAFLPSPSSFQAIDIDQSRGVGQRYALLSLSQAAPHWYHFLNGQTELK
jgi:Clostripain family